jgi:AcrR family transcriptional regulator
METKERIIRKASELFCQYGIRSVSMDELASSLNISKRTIYETFKDKEEILLSVLSAKKAQRKADFELLVSHATNVIEVFLAIIEIHQTVPMCCDRFYDDIHRYYPTVSRFIHDVNKENNRKLRSFLKNGIKQGYVRDDLNVKVAAFLVEESTFTHAYANQRKRPKFSYHELFYTMMINFLRGISTAKGIEIIDDYLAKKRNKTKK